MFKVDFHTHSTLSHDGGISEKQYKKALGNGKVDVVAITDHNEVDFALELNAELGERIIVGEEIMTNVGEVIGLFLQKKVQPFMGLVETIAQIKDQGGIVYIPHPLDIRRAGLDTKSLFLIKEQIDMFEVFNARNIVPGGNSRASEFSRQEEFSEKTNLVRVVGSDSHSYFELGKTYNLFPQIPTRQNIIKLSKIIEYRTKYVGPFGFTAPKVNKLRKFLQKLTRTAKVKD